jgi:Methyltransferase FkbM domain
MKDLIINALTAYGISVGRCADFHRVEALIHLLRPVQTTKDLIRVGGCSDGGYLVPNDLDGIVGCFSPGVGPTVAFEQEIAARGIPCYLADASVPGPPVNNSMFKFKKQFLGVVDDDSTITLDTWVRSCAPATGDLLLQMDIEGAEWLIFANVSEEVLKRFRIIVVELHRLERLVDALSFELMSAGFKRLLRDFHVVHNHPNNVARPFKANGLTIPRYLEITFYRRDRAGVTGYATQFPHPLDEKNVRDRPDLVLPPVWYGRPGDKIGP